LKKKIENQVQYKAFQNTFPDYKGNQNKDEAQGYIRDYFLESVKQYTENGEVRVFCHFTCAIDTNSISQVFKDVREHVVMSKIELFV